MRASAGADDRARVRRPASVLEAGEAADGKPLPESAAESAVEDSSSPSVVGRGRTRPAASSAKRMTASVRPIASSVALRALEGQEVGEGTPADPAPRVVAAGDERASVNAASIPAAAALLAVGLPSSGSGEAVPASAVSGLVAVPPIDDWAGAAAAAFSRDLLLR